MSFLVKPFEKKVFKEVIFLLKYHQTPQVLKRPSIKKERKNIEKEKKDKEKKKKRKKKKSSKSLFK
jgi:hypothetical protein